MEKSTELKVNNPILFTPLGSRKMKSIKRQQNPETGKDEIVVTNEIDIQEEIQRSSNATDLALLKKKYQLTGEIPAATGGYGDTEIDLTMVPDNIHELYKVRNKLQDYYNGLDAKLQKTYGDFDGFVTAIYTGNIPDATKEYYVALTNEQKLKAIEEDKKKEGNE